MLHYSFLKFAILVYQYCVIPVSSVNNSRFVTVDAFVLLTPEICRHLFTPYGSILIKKPTRLQISQQSTATYSFLLLANHPDCLLHFFNMDYRLMLKAGEGGWNDSHRLNIKVYYNDEVSTLFLSLYTSSHEVFDRIPHSIHLSAPLSVNKIMNPGKITRK